ncbi:beta-keto acid cleavage family enzyme [Sphingosinicella rhizophila]|uniref:3-keto-5-aminohexanoate cleavage protein n=1 Tax=Sphingosinicella rhizophila TaxID=3050082 RepID=A0ABU3QAC5_9SPHN|nr:3-keto-5-aminohexanoate cleavage protein [Sphingosinicella sp. GR2756]MDT9600352.1 3-keto-5-aminohexanoate cleavage protein [Sphingosinicella sp. GR2756]
MRRADKVIVTCAVTGSIHTPSMSPYLPITANQIAEQAIEAAEAGASILHLHARDPEDGRPTQDPARFMAFLPRIKQATNAVVNITTGGGMGMTLDERLAPALAAKAELASLNMGSMNFGVWELATRRKEWKHEWEAPYLARSYDAIYPNTFAMIDRLITTLGDGCGTRFEFECYDVGHLYNLAYFVEKGRLKPPYLIQCILGVRGGIGADPENLQHMKRIADRLFGDDYLLSCLAIGKAQMGFLTQCALLGGSVRVGLEDSLYLAKGQLAETNAQQVRKIRHILEELGLDIASPDEARQMLQLKGGDQVAF